jgi:hypothetical protein
MNQARFRQLGKIEESVGLTASAKMNTIEAEKAILFRMRLVAHHARVDG